MVPRRRWWFVTGAVWIGLAVFLAIVVSKRQVHPARTAPDPTPLAYDYYCTIQTPWKVREILAGLPPGTGRDRVARHLAELEQTLKTPETRGPPPETVSIPYVLGAEGDYARTQSGAGKMSARTVSKLASRDTFAYTPQWMFKRLLFEFSKDHPGTPYFGLGGTPNDFSGEREPELFAKLNYMRAGTIMHYSITFDSADGSIAARADQQWVGN
jgi:hypothetical protein